MVYINCAKFSAKDLVLFIESIEQITHMEHLKKQHQQRFRAQYLADTLRYLSQKYPAGSSSTLSSTDAPEEESVMESFEQKQIVCISRRFAKQHHNHYEVPSSNKYQVMNPQSPNKSEHEDSMSCHTTIYSLPFECVASTKLEEYDYETLNLKSKEKSEYPQYEKPTQVVQHVKPKAKFSLLNLFRKNYKKLFAKNSNIWLKSESWTRLTVY